MQAGEYIRVDAEVLPVKASSKVVVIEEVDGDKDSVQIAYDGHIKGLKAGNVLLRAVVVKRDNTGAITGKIEKYFRVSSSIVNKRVYVKISSFFNTLLDIYMIKLISDLKLKKLTRCHNIIKI